MTWTPPDSSAQATRRSRVVISSRAASPAAASCTADSTSSDQPESTTSAVVASEPNSSPILTAEASIHNPEDQHSPGTDSLAKQECIQPVSPSPSSHSWVSECSTRADEALARSDATMIIVQSGSSPATREQDSEPLLYDRNDPSIWPYFISPSEYMHAVPFGPWPYEPYHPPLWTYLSLPVPYATMPHCPYAYPCPPPPYCWHAVAPPPVPSAWASPVSFPDRCHDHDVACYGHVLDGADPARCT
ncbi:hypothetical protein OE88DRAFT_926294 [Heliocybe sulcata]|uniref:Uncharacterized protein n=1 Tax=Heliocybe sulcata TaxID=5364 RepID=A0A5C3MNB0_9AGAM|nr:hypothetical protein OE88DRAFT_926294 [Heliocybe sulcata]